MPAGLDMARGDLALTLTAQAAGTVTSGPISPAGQAAFVMAMVNTSAATGTGPTLTVTIEESDNGTSGWAAVPGGAGAALAGVGNQVVTAAPSKSFVRISAVVAGTTPAVTAKIATLIFAD
jgi:hypothetical protein